jgi:hypothetical protein
MRIILEGPDNSGKTTLASMLRSNCPGLTYYHPGGPPSDQAEEDRCLTDQMLMLMNTDPILMDRCTGISQQVYSPAIWPETHERRQSWVTNAHKGGVIFVYCRPSTDWLMSFENFTWRDGESEEFKQKIIRDQHVFIDRYDELMRTIPHVSYDYKGEGAQTIVTYLSKALRGDQASAQFIRNITAPINHAGHPRSF